MYQEPEGASARPPTRDELAELDRKAWNLPGPRPEPVGPVREVWPVRDVKDVPTEKAPFEPAA
jgi:hypothetical protein